MRYVIYGAGAVGGVIGAKLFEQGIDVVVIARGEHLQIIQARGLTLESPEGTRTLRVPAVGHPQEIGFHDDNVVFLTMKTQDTRAALSDLEAAAGDRVAVVCAQNGVENERLALRRFSRVYGMMVVLPATYLRPGLVQANSGPLAGVLEIGCYPRGTDGLADAIAADLARSGFACAAREDVMRWKYAKLLSNLANSFQAACGLEARAPDLLKAVRGEAEACYRAAGIEWASDEEMAKRREGSIRLGSGGAARLGGSTWQSLARGTGSTEADYLNGEIVLLGRLYGVATPVNAVLQRAANRLARQALPPGSVSVDDLRREIEPPRSE